MTRIGYVSFSPGQFDSRTERMARSAIGAGYEVVAYARWEPGLPMVEEREGYRLVRVVVDTRRGLPLIGRLFRGRRPSGSSERAADPRATGALADVGAAPGGAGGRVRRALVGTRLWEPARAIRDVSRLPRRWLLFPLSLRAFALALDDVAEPADLWHGMSIGALPAVVRRKKRQGGAAIYDSRDIYMHARELARVGGFRRRLFESAERRWAHACDLVITVNDSYAEILARQLRVPRPPVVMNCPERWDLPDPRPDLIRRRLVLPAGTRVVLYQGGLLSERGIEESMDAILKLRDAVLVILGYGRLRDQIVAAAARPPYRDRVFLLDAVPPSELLAWTASADLMVMAIQPSSLNHRHTTPNKLFEAMSAGVPVVASDLPGMAAIVTATGCGLVCDPTDPASIATAMSRILDAPDDERRRYAEQARIAADTTYNWETQATTLIAAYRRVIGEPSTAGAG